MRRSSRLRSAVVLASLAASVVACSDAPPPPVASPSTVAAAAAPAAVASLPDAVSDLATIVPADASFVVELPSFDKLGDLVPAEQRALIAMLRPFAEGGAADKLGLESSIVHALVDAVDRATIFGDLTSAAAVARFRDRAAVEKLLAAMQPVAADSVPGTRAVFTPPSAATQRLVWYPRPRILVWASSSAAAERVERAGTCEIPSFATSARRLPDDGGALRVYADLAALVAKDAELAGIFKRGSSARADVAFDGKSLHSKLDVSLVGERIPKLGKIIDMNKASLPPRFPEETALVGSLSIARRPNKLLGDLVTEIGRVADKDSLFTMVDALLRTQLGLGLDDFDKLLGGEMSFGIAVAPGAHLDLDQAKPKLDDVAFFAAIPTKDDARAKKLVAAIAKRSQKDPPKGYKASISPSGVRFTAVDAPPMRFETHKGTLVFAVGGNKWMDRVAAALDRGERTLGASAIYAPSAAEVEKPANGLLWTDVERATKLLGKGGGSAGGSRVAMARLLFGTADRGIDFTVESEGGAETFLFGSGAAIAIAGVRRYIAQSKVAEAKNTVGAISRSAAMAYEREYLGAGGATTHRLCKSAPPVPARVPAGVKYASSDAPNTDYATGDDERGWHCLRFSMMAPQYYQYEYRQGGPYKGPARGGPDPGPGGFEVSAEGDLDGNGKTSLFTRTGTIDPKTHVVRLSPDLFVSDELE